MVRHLFARRSLSQNINQVPALRQHRRRPLRFERLEAREMLSVNGDFNGDGFDDLAAGAIGEDVAGQNGAGAVNIIYGSPRGLTTVGNQFWNLNSPGVNGIITGQDAFGFALAVGDFNGDGFSDLAIGSFSKVVSGQAGAGSVNVLYGSKSGLRAGSVDQLWTQDSPGVNDAAEVNDFFGTALAAGDFNGDGRDDLAIGSRGEDVGSVEDAGMVNVLYGSSSGLTATNDQSFTQNSAGIDNAAGFDNSFGYSLAAGDFDDDGRDDLAIGVPYEDFGAIVYSGAVEVIYGSSNGLTGSGDQFWQQDTSGVADTSETSDNFGLSLAVGDFNDDGRDDLAIGAPGEIIAPGIMGQVSFLYGFAEKLKPIGGRHNISVNELDPSIYANGNFGFALAAGDFSGDGRDDLAIGAPTSLVSGQGFSGVFFVALGTTQGISAEGAQRWLQADFGSTAGMNDNFGRALAAGDYNGDNEIDLAIGASGDAEAGLDSAGTIFVLYGFGLIDPRAPRWFQSYLSASDGAEPGDSMGFVLA